MKKHNTISKSVACWRQLDSFWYCIKSLVNARFVFATSHSAATGHRHSYQLQPCCCLVTEPCPPLFATPWTVDHQTPLSMGFPRQEYWNGCYFLLQGIFPTQGSHPHLYNWATKESPLCHWICLKRFTATLFFMRGQNRIPLEFPINKDELTFYPSPNILCFPKNGDHLNSPHSLWFVDFKNLSVSPFGIKIVCLIIINLKCLTATQILSRQLDIWIRNSGPQERGEGKRYQFRFHHIGLFFFFWLKQLHLFLGGWSECHKD